MKSILFAVLFLLIPKSAGQKRTLLGLDDPRLGRKELFWSWMTLGWVEKNSFGVGNWVSGQN